MAVSSKRLWNPGRNGEPVGISPSEFLLRELRRRRKAAGLTQIELGKKCFCSDTVVSGIETGTKPVTLDYLKLVDTALETGGYFETLWTELVKDDAAPVWLREWIEIEREASALRWYEPAFVPGLLQTEAYARATLTGERLTPDEADQLVRARIDRQSILHRDLPPLFVAVLDESILYRSAYGNRPLMADQLLHLETYAGLPQVQIHIVPTAVGIHPGLAGAFILADAPDGSAAAHADNQLAARIVGTPGEVATLAGRWERLRGIALPVDQSLELIKKAAASWT